MAIGKPLLTKLLAAARHNRRAIAAELRNTGHIDPARSGSNITLRGASTPEDIADEANLLLEGVRLRRDTVIVEIVFSLPAGTAIPLKPYFVACTTWAESHFRCHVLSSDIHLDESSPHCHVLLLPLQGGKMNGSKVVGFKAQMAAHHECFHEEVGAAFGLPRRQPILAGSARDAAARAILDRLMGTKDAAIRSAIWLPIQQAIKDNPVLFAEALGVDVPSRRKQQRSFTAIMTSPGKGPKWEPPIPIGFAPSKAEAYPV